MKIRIIGTGDAYACDRANSSIWIEEENYHLLIDCGPTVCQSLWQHDDWQKIDAVYFTHLHPDHALGLTSLVNRFNANGRKQPLKVFCHKGKEKRLKQLVEYGFWSDTENFAVEFILLDTQDPTATFNIGPFKCQSALTIHGVENHSLCFSTESNTVFYSGDGCITEDSMALIQHSDIAFIECLAMQLPQDANHSDFKRATHAAERSPKTNFFLYHIASGELSEMRGAAKAFTNIHIANEASILNL